MSNTMPDLDCAIRNAAATFRARQRAAELKAAAILQEFSTPYGQALGERALRAKAAPFQADARRWVAFARAAERDGLLLDLANVNPGLTVHSGDPLYPLYEQARTYQRVLMSGPEIVDELAAGYMLPRTASELPAAPAAPSI